MSTSRRSSTARRSARLSWASTSSALERSSWSVSPPICRSISSTIRLVEARWRSRLSSSSATSCTWPCSRSCCRASRSRSALISSSRRRLSWSSRAGFCAAAGAGTAMASAPSRRSWRRTLDDPAVGPAADHAEVAADADEAAQQAEEHAEDDDHEHVDRLEEDQAGQRRGVAPEDGVAAVAEQQREHAAHEPLEPALEEEWSPDEPVGGTHEPHDVDLPRALQDGEPDRDADDHDRHGREDAADHEAEDPGQVPQVVELLDPVPPVAHVLDEREALEAARDCLGVHRVAKALPEPDLERRGERVGLQVAVGVAELDELPPGPGQRVVLSDVGDGKHLRERRHVLRRDGDRLGRGAPEHERHDLDPLLDSPQRLAQVQGDEPEEADREEGERDRGDGERGQEWRPAEREERLPEQEPHRASAPPASSCALS